MKNLGWYKKTRKQFTIKNGRNIEKGEGIKRSTSLV
jgi:hypothetical protein